MVERNSCCRQSQGQRVQLQRLHLACVCDARIVFWCEFKAAQKRGLVMAKGQVQPLVRGGVEGSGGQGGGQGLLQLQGAAGGRERKR